MAVSKDFITYVEELLSPLGPLRIRRMFGAAGVYLNDVFFAVLDDEALYLKVDDDSRPTFKAVGSRPFVIMEKDGRAMETSYWLAPPEALESPEAAEPWARLGYEAAVRVKAAKVKPSKRSART